VTYYDQAGEMVVGGRPMNTDGVVSVSSVQALPYSTHLPVIRLPAPGLPDTVHSQQPRTAIFQTALSPYYGMGGNHYYSGAAGGVTRQYRPGVALPELPVQWPAVPGLLLPGATQTISVTVDVADQVTFQLGRPDDTAVLDFTLRDPSGQVITATSPYPGSSYAGTLDGVVYRIDNPLPGIWQAVVAADAVPPAGEAYYVSGTFSGGVQVNPMVSAPIARLGAPVTLSATLLDGTTPLDGASVQADLVLGNDGPTASVVLAPQGGGVYRGTYTPTLPGTYQVAFTAAGHTAGGPPFQRVSPLQFQASAGAALIGPYHEQAYAADGALYSSLLISATAIITEAGQYRLTGRLVAPDDREVATAQEEYTLAAGLTELPLDFAGEAIGAAVADGPYRLQDLALAQVSGEELAQDFQPQAYTTAPYSRYSWQRDNLVLRGPATDQGIDTNGNGRYEYLDVRLPVDVRGAGVYSASVNLLTADGTFVTTANLPGLALTQGSTTLVVRFDGGAIGASGADGPYRVDDLTLWGGPEPEVYLPAVVSATQAYTAGQFEGTPLPTPIATTAPGAGGPAPRRPQP
jgi:hypothetical protein